MAKTKTVRLAATPRIRAKTITAANLLRQIKTLVLDEPKRLDMGSWVGAFMNAESAAIYRPGKGGGGFVPGPACGTVGCIAGWGSILLRSDGSKQYRTPGSASTLMNRVLGQTEDLVFGPDMLFRPSALKEFGEQPTPAGDLGGAPGTKAHARAVARRIDKFLERHPELETRVIDVAALRESGQV